MISDERIMGFVEGEGCFSVAIQRAIDRRPRKGAKKRVWARPAQGFWVKPNFKITSVEEENAVLYAIKERFGFGKVYTQPRTGNLRNISNYCVQKSEDLKKIAEFFKGQTFHTSKGRSFQLWCQCLEIFLKGEHLTKEGLLRICELRDQMNPTRLGIKNARKADTIRQILEIKPERIEAHAKAAQSLHNPNLPGVENWCEKYQGNHKLAPFKVLPKPTAQATP